MMKSKYFNRSNIKCAYSFVLRTQRKESIKEEGRDEKVKKKNNIFFHKN